MGSTGGGGRRAYPAMVLAPLRTKAKVDEVSRMPNHPSPPPSPSGPTCPSSYHAQKAAPFKALPLLMLCNTGSNSVTAHVTWPCQQAGFCASACGLLLQKHGTAASLWRASSQLLNSNCNSDCRLIKLHTDAYNTCSCIRTSAHVYRECEVRHTVMRFHACHMHGHPLCRTALGIA